MKNSAFGTRTQRWLRFIFGGGVNTAFTYGVYIAANLLLEYQWAYLIAYAMGVVFSYWFNAVVVFRVPLTWKGFFAYPLVYVIQYGASALLLGVLIEVADVRETLAPLAVTIGMVPLTYMMSKWVLGWTNRLEMVTDRNVVNPGKSKLSPLHRS
jgi:putative flippase GtrA